MAPKKTAATTSSTKIKTAKKGAEEMNIKEEAPKKKTKEKVAKKTKAEQEEEINLINTEEVSADTKETVNKKRATKKEQNKPVQKETVGKKKNSPKEQDDMAEQNKKVTKGTKSKKKTMEEVDADVNDKNEEQNGNLAKKETNSRKTKADNSEETAPKNKGKKAPASKAQAKQSKKIQSENGSEDNESDKTSEAEDGPAPKKGRKRKAPAKSDADLKKSEPENKTARINATATNWEKIDFKCDSKNSKGQSPNFHITSWNVDGLRAWLKKGGLDILQLDDPDIFCVQETKCGEEKLPKEVKEIDGYETLWCSSDREGYAGVGIATKVKPLNVTYGIDSDEHDNEGRCITLEYEKFFLVNVYVPNAGRKLVTLPKRLEWNKLFKDHVKKLDKTKPVIICGDMNVAHTEIDLANPKTNTKNAGFTIEEREGMTDFLDDGYVDTYRKLYPDKEKAYTFWTYMSNARSKNVGWRLDYFIVSNRFMENVCDNLIHGDVLGSDHCPISLHFNV